MINLHLCTQRIFNLRIWFEVWNLWATFDFTSLFNWRFAWCRHLTTTTRMHFAAMFVMQICVTHERFFTKEQILNTIACLKAFWYLSNDVIMQMSYCINTHLIIIIERFNDQSHQGITDQSEPRPEAQIPSSDDESSLDSEDDYRSGSRNITHQQQSF